MKIAFLPHANSRNQWTTAMLLHEIKRIQANCQTAIHAPMRQTNLISTTQPPGPSDANNRTIHNLPTEMQTRSVSGA